MEETELYQGSWNRIHSNNALFAQNKEKSGSQKSEREELVAKVMELGTKNAEKKADLEAAEEIASKFRKNEAEDAEEAGRIVKVEIKRLTDAIAEFDVEALRYPVVLTCIVLSCPTIIEWLPSSDTNSTFPAAFSIVSVPFVKLKL